MWKRTVVFTHGMLDGFLLTAEDLNDFAGPKQGPKLVEAFCGHPLQLMRTTTNEIVVVLAQATALHTFVENVNIVRRANTVAAWPPESEWEIAQRQDADVAKILDEILAALNERFQAATST